MQQDAPTKAFTSVSQKLAQLPTTQSECCIYRVHNVLRNVNDKAYDPKFIAIGPYHHNKDNLKMMEDHKLRYFHSLLQRKGENGETFFTAVGQLEPQARQCYAEDIGLSESDFIEMLVLDGCFIIELVLKFDMPCLREQNDAIFQMPWIMSLLQRDLMLFENQIPFVVLLKLYDLIRGPHKHRELITYLRKFFRDLYPISRDNMTVEKSPQEVKHLLDLIYCSGRPPFVALHAESECKSSGTSEQLLMIQSASKLREANVKFQKGASKNFYEIEFKQGTMYLQPLRITDYTEDCFRNLIAYEQFLGSDVMFMADYFSFMGCLIDTSKDVEILRCHGIIENWLGDDEMIAKMFNKLGEAITIYPRSFSYAETFQEVNMHFNRRTNRWMKILRRQYLNHPWKIISLVVAVVLLLLTMTQTVFSILQVV